MVNNKKEGQLKDYDTDKVISIFNFINGVKHGVHILYPTAKNIKVKGKNIKMNFYIFSRRIKDNNYINDRHFYTLECIFINGELMSWNIEFDKNGVYELIHNYYENIDTMTALLKKIFEQKFCIKNEYYTLEWTEKYGNIKYSIKPSIDFIHLDNISATLSDIPSGLSK